MLIIHPRPAYYHNISLALSQHLIRIVRLGEDFSLESVVLQKTLVGVAAYFDVICSDRDHALRLCLLE